MDANPNQRPTASELFDIFYYWWCYHRSYMDEKNHGYYGREITGAFEEADKEIPNISTSY